MNTAALVDSLHQLINHPRTPDNERDAAKRALARVTARTSSDGPYLFKFEGAKYRSTRGYDVKTIATLIREDIKITRKAAKRAGMHGAELMVADPIAALPQEARVTVACPQSGSTPKISVTIRGLAGDTWWTFARGWVGHDGYRSEFGSLVAFPTSALANLGAALRCLASAYSFDDSDTQSDYVHCRFSLAVRAMSPTGYMDDIGRGRPMQDRVSEWIDPAPVD